MPQTRPTTELNEGFSEPGAAARPWAEVAGHAQLRRLAAVKPDKVLAFGKSPYSQTRYRFTA